MLEDTGDAAADNVDKVKRENARVKERLRKKRAAMFASWCMMLTVSKAYSLMPFNLKKRGVGRGGGVGLYPNYLLRFAFAGGGAQDVKGAASTAYSFSTSVFE